VCAQAPLFFNETVSKKCGNYTFMFGGRFGVSQTGMGNTDDGFIHQIKVFQRLGRKDSIQITCQDLCLAALDFKLFSKTFKI
jgi:hypothetical protein